MCGDKRVVWQSEQGARYSEQCDRRYLARHHRSHSGTDNTELLGVGIVGTVVAALCCFTPALLLLLGAIGLGWLTGYLDYVLVPTLAFFIGLTVYAIGRKRG